MNFSKVKIIICFCLVIVNVIFGVMCIRLVENKNYVSEQEAKLASEHLGKNGINVEFGKEERKIYRLPIYAAKIEEAQEYVPLVYKKLTEAFFNVSVTDSAYIKIPEGYSVSVKNDKGILLGTSSMIEGNRFECYLEDAVNPKDINEISKIPILQTLKQEKSEQVKLAQNFIDKAFRSNRIEFVNSGTREYNNGKIVCFSGSYSEVSALNIYVNVYVKKGKIVCCGGRISDVDLQKEYSAHLIDSINLMYSITEYLGENNSVGNENESIVVNNIGMKYKMYEYDSTTYYLIPTWTVEYTDGKGEKNIIAVDAVTGGNIERLK